MHLKQLGPRLWGSSSWWSGVVPRGYEPLPSMLDHVANPSPRKGVHRQCRILGKETMQTLKKLIIFGLGIFLVKLFEKLKQNLIVSRINFQRQMILTIHLDLGSKLRKPFKLPKSYGNIFYSQKSKLRERFLESGFKIKINSKLNSN